VKEEKVVCWITVHVFQECTGLRKGRIFASSKEDRPGKLVNINTDPQTYA